MNSAAASETTDRVDHFSGLRLRITSQHPKHGGLPTPAGRSDDR